VAAMREVPAPFFQEAFNLDQRQLWEELVQVGGQAASLAGWQAARGTAWRAVVSRPCLPAVPPTLHRPAHPALRTSQVSSEEARAESLERLSVYLDTMESHLVREIAARTGACDGWGWQAVAVLCRRLQAQQ
jgi:hypothetical protein